MECCGFCAAELGGRIFLRDTVKLVSDVFSSGSDRECWTASCGRYAKICWRAANWGLEEGFVDASFAGAKRGAIALVRIADSHGLPIAVGVTSASANESTLVEGTLAQRHIAAVPQRLIGDKVYDSDPLDARLGQLHGIEMISPNRQKRRKTQDGRPLRRYLRRWKIERLFAWLKNFRRLTSRWERYSTNFLGMVQLGCLLILMRHL